MIPGGWEVLTAIGNDEMEIFNNISAKLVNAVYTPLCAAKQSFGGTNICFICKAVKPDEREYFAKVLVHVSIGGTPEIQATKEILL